MRFAQTRHVLKSLFISWSHNAVIVSHEAWRAGASSPLAVRTAGRGVWCARRWRSRRRRGSSCTHCQLLSITSAYTFAASTRFANISCTDATVSLISNFPQPNFRNGTRLFRFKLVSRASETYNQLLHTHRMTPMRSRAPRMSSCRPPYEWTTRQNASDLARNLTQLTTVPLPYPYRTSTRVAHRLHRASLRVAAAARVDRAMVLQRKS